MKQTKFCLSAKGHLIQPLPLLVKVLFVSRHKKKNTKQKTKLMPFEGQKKTANFANASF